jgi:hypothetical protein
LGQSFIIHELEKTIGITLLGKGNSDWCWLVSDEVLKISCGYVSIHEFEKNISFRFLCKSNSDWRWLVSDEVLKISSGDIDIHEFEKTISIGFYIILTLSFLVKLNILIMHFICIK